MQGGAGQGRPGQDRHETDRMRRPQCLLRHLVLPLVACTIFLVRFTVLPLRVTFSRNIDDVGKDEILGGFS